MGCTKYSGFVEMFNCLTICLQCSGLVLLGAGRLGTRTFRPRDIYAPEVKIFFPKFFQILFPKKNHVSKTILKKVF